MSQNKLPEGWNEGKVRRVLAHYGEQTEDEAVAEDEVGIEPSVTVINVPHDLVSKVRELIAKQRDGREVIFRAGIGLPVYDKATFR